MATEMDDRNFQIAWNNVSQGKIGVEQFQELLDPIMKVFFKKFDTFLKF
jgi:hypothetical protein